jgi:hypothetical protein
MEMNRNDVEEMGLVWPVSIKKVSKKRANPPRTPFGMILAYAIFVPTPFQFQILQTFYRLPHILYYT